MNQEELVWKGIQNGSIRIRRFLREEQSGSSLAADRLLWLAVVRAEAELAEAYSRGMCPRSRKAPSGAETPSRFLSSLAQPLPSSFEQLEIELGSFGDRGQESVVYDGADGFVYKLRPLRPSILSGYLAPFANVISHNRIFPRDRYTLENIYFDGALYYMVLRQERVDVKLDVHGYPVKPTAVQLRTAVAALGIGLQEYYGGNIEEGDSSESESDDVAERLRFYNGDYYISDIQPGRNSVIDAVTGDVRFIDPRITLNDPHGPITHVSQFGRRREQMPGQIIPTFVFGDDRTDEDEEE